MAIEEFIGIERQSAHSNCHEIVGQPIKLSREAKESSIAYSISTITNNDDSVTVEYTES